MLSHTFAKHPLVGYLLVALQFGLLALLAVMAAPALLHGQWPLFSGLLATLAVLLGVWTLAYNRLGNFNIRPLPKADGVLVTGGPYRYMRHPMYTSVLLVAAAMASAAGLVDGWLVWLAWSVWGVLVLDLWVKASLEERWLRETFANYASYSQCCKRFVPWLL